MRKRISFYGINRHTKSGMRPAILVPYKNRENYVQAFLDKVPKYLEEVNGITDYAIYIAEQTSSDVFNLALSRDVAAKFALQDGRGFDYFIFHDVDIIPVEKVDYGMWDYNVAWFMTAGSCKIFVDDFVKSNGYNPHFVGWGGEDTEFYHRLESLNCKLKEWHRIEESKGAIMLNLEMPKLSSLDAVNWSKSYFGHTGNGPLFIPATIVDGVAIERYNKSNDFLTTEHKRKNSALCSMVYNLPHFQKQKYIRANGMNMVDLSGVFIKESTEKLTWLAYDSKSVLKNL